MNTATLLNTNPIDDYANSLNDTGAVLPLLNSGDSNIAIIETIGDNDLFKINLITGTAYSFAVKGMDSNDGTLADPYLTIIDNTGTVIATDDDSGIYNNALLKDFVAPNTGIYYLSASGNNASTGSYTITATDNTNPASYHLSGSVFIIGTFEQNQTLYAASNLVDLNGSCGTISYHWWANNQEIASGSYYVLTEAQVGMVITVTADYSSYSSTSVVSVSSSSSNTTVININDVVIGDLIISGIYSQGQTLTVTNNFYDADGLGTVSYSWYADNYFITTGNSYSLTELDVNKTISVMASYTDLHGMVETVSNSINTVIVNTNDAPTGTVMIDGIMTQGQTLIASNTLADADGLGTISYTWQANTITLGTGNSYVLTEAEVNKTITLIASYTDGHGSLESVSSRVSNGVLNSNDAPVGTVSITGIIAQGQTVTVDNNISDADGLGLISYLWQANNITIATGNSYTLTKNEVAKTISVIASYTDGHGTVETVTSTPTTAVININQVPTGTVTISGMVKQGQTLTANNNLADGDGLGIISYQWQADTIAIGTGNTYLLTEAEVGKTITVIASYIDGYNSLEMVSSKASNSVLNSNDAPTGNVTINGLLIQGQRLSANSNLADADGLGTISYSWKANNIIIATGDSYQLTANEIGAKITLVASYIDGHGTAETKSSAASTAVQGINHLPTGKVMISGTVTQGQTLTVSNTLADVDGLGTIMYIWQADGVKIAKNSDSFTLTEAQVGKVITVIASYSDGHDVAESVTSNTTRAVVNINDEPTGKVTINGTVTQNQKLTVANTLADADGLGVISYTWQADNSKIATANTVTLTEAQVGKVITVIASYTDAHGKVESVSSHASRAVVNVNDEPTGSVNIKGTAMEGKTLTATDNIKDADGLGVISYTWKAGATVLATGTSYTLTSTEVGKKITVMASYTDAHGTVEKVTSDASSVVVNVDSGVKITALHGLSTSENDGKGTSVTPPKAIDFAISLKTQPSQNVSLSFSSSDSSEGVITGIKTMTFTANNWNVVQTLIVTGVNDYLNDGDIAYQLNTRINSIDVDYKALLVPAVDLINKDDGRDVAQDMYGDVGGSKIDKLTGMDGNDKIHGLNRADELLGGLGNDTLWGGYGDDNLFGQAGNDALWGEQENDYLDGGAGNDSLYGGEGIDTMIGGTGNDTYYLGYDASDSINDGGATTEVDTVVMPFQLTSYTLANSIENGIISNEGNQDSSLTGNSSDNTLTGNGGNNTLSGGLGRDSLFGGTGDDVLEGGTGNDALKGEAGQDSFVFNSTLSGNIDTILDFSVADDSIKLSKGIFTSLNLGNLTANAFQLGTAATDATDRIIYNKATGAVYYDDDGIGAHAAIQIATIGINLTLTQADFVIIA